LGRQRNPQRTLNSFFAVFFIKPRRPSYQNPPKARENGKGGAGPKGLIFLPTTNQERGHYMHFIKIFILIVLSLAIGIFGCAKEKAEAPTQERITKNLVPPKSEIKGPNFLVELSDLQVVMDVDIASKEIVETPSLMGHIKITNKSEDILDVQAVTLEYLDEVGKPIPYQSGEKISKVSLFLRAIKPEEVTEGSFHYDVTIPRMAVKEKALGKIEINLVYVPSPLKRETLTVSEKVE
jgi:hypothetical protein